MSRKEFISSASKATVAGIVRNNIKRNLSNDEIQYIIEFIEENARSLLAYNTTVKNAQIDAARTIIREWSASDNQYVAPLATDYEDQEPSDAERSDDEIDIHTNLKEFIYSGDAANRAAMIRPEQEYVKQSTVSVDFLSSLGIGNLLELVSAVNPRALTRHFPQLVLDTRNRSLVDSTPGQRTSLSWSRNTSGGYERGALNSLKPVRNIVQIECATIYMPNINDVAFNEYRQISMLIQEFSDQSSILSDSVRFHFLFDAETISNDVGSERLKLTSPYRQTSYVGFDPPLTSIDTLTITFGSPAERLTLGYDRDSNPVSVSSSNPVVFTCSINHNLRAGDLVYLEGFTTDNPSTDSYNISIANRTSGHVIQNPTNTTFEIAILDTTGMVNPIVTSIIFGPQRFFIPFKLRYVGGQVSRYA